MALSWIEIKDRALRFANEWKDDVLEDAEAKSFQNDFFTVFGVTRRPLRPTHDAARLSQSASGPRPGR